MSHHSDAKDCPEIWQSPPQELILSNSEVHLWYVHPLTQVSPASLHLLSSDERDRAAKYRFDRDRDRFVAGRSALRIILGRYLGEAPERLRFQYGPHGKPALCDSEVRFNVSHSQDHVLIAVSRDREVGVDIEVVEGTSDPLELSQRFFTPRESEMVQQASADRQTPLFLSLWTRKEAWMKAKGTGLSEPLDRFDVSDILNVLGLSKVIDTDSETIWSIGELQPSKNVVAAVAIEGAVTRMSYWRASHSMR